MLILSARMKGNGKMTSQPITSHPNCDVCGREKIALRRPTRTTYYCVMKDNAGHKEQARLNRYAAQTARIEAMINNR
jgi:hypothetical protein